MLSRRGRLERRKREIEIEGGKGRIRGEMKEGKEERKKAR